MEEGGGGEGTTWTEIRGWGFNTLSSKSSDKNEEFMNTNPLKPLVGFN